MERQNGMSEIGDNWSWEEDFQKDLDEEQQRESLQIKTCVMDL